MNGFVNTCIHFSAVRNRAFHATSVHESDTHKHSAANYAAMSPARLPNADVADHCSDVGRSVTRRGRRGEMGGLWVGLRNASPLSLSPHRILDPILCCVRREE